jgi:hypothetical protein
VIWIPVIFCALLLMGIGAIGVVGWVRWLNDKFLRRFSTFNPFTGQWTDPPDDPGKPPRQE